MKGESNKNTKGNSGRTKEKMKVVIQSSQIKSKRLVFKHKELKS